TRIGHNPTQQPHRGTQELATEGRWRDRSIRDARHSEGSIGQGKPLACLERASRTPPWPAVQAPQQQAGHMDASDRNRLTPTLAGRAPSTYGSYGLRDGLRPASP